MEPAQEVSGIDDVIQVQFKDLPTVPVVIAIQAGADER